MIRALLAAFAVAAAPLGVVDRSIKNDNIMETICKPGYEVPLPSAKYLDKIRMRLVARGNGGGDLDDALDYIIPLELGGAPRNIRNFQLQEKVAFRVKNAEEAVLHDEVCAGHISLSSAQLSISR